MTFIIIFMCVVLICGGTMATVTTRCMEFQSGQSCQIHSKQLSIDFYPKQLSNVFKIYNCQNFVDEIVVELVRNQLSNSGTFHSHSNVHCQLVQKNCQMQEFTLLNTLKFIMVKHTSPPCSKHLNALLF